MIRIFGVAHLSYHFTWAPPFVQIWLDLQNAQLEFIQQMSLSSLLHPDQRQINSTDFESLARIRPALRFHIQPKLNFSCIFRSNFIDREISSDIQISIDLYKMNPKSTNPKMKNVVHEKSLHLCIICNEALRLLVLQIFFWGGGWRPNCPRWFIHVNTI